MRRLLVVDDEPSICWSLGRVGKTLGHEVVTAGSIGEAFAALGSETFDLLLLDVRLPDRDGLSAMAELRALAPALSIVVMTAYGDLPTAVTAVRQGAYEYLIKPFDLGTLERVIERALSSAAAVSPTRANRELGVEGALVGKSSTMQHVFREIALAAASDSNVHLWGESGTGKELFARAIHHFSRRSAGPLVPVHLASLHESLAESELFGHVRGAFTGASESRRGLLEQAHGGTLFLDEVAEISAALQVKLLRAIEYGEILPVGAAEPRKVDFRVITATHQDLGQVVAAGKFRHDLFYRLNTFQVRIPPLRERPDDIAELTEHFAILSAERSSLVVPRIARETIAALQARPWRGNVRELRNAVEFAVIQARGGVMLPEHLPAIETSRPAETPAVEMVTEGVRQWAEQLWHEPQSPVEVYQQLMQMVERPVLEVALAHNSGHVAAAARSLGLHRVTVHRKAKALGLLAPPKD